jgi:hypothetical protein
MINSPVWMVSSNNITLRFNELQLVEGRLAEAVSVTKCAESVLMNEMGIPPASTTQNLCGE